MAAPYKGEFIMSGKRITSLVLDAPEFKQLVESCSDMLNADAQARLVEAKHIPAMSRGTKTQHVFDKYDIKTDFLSVVVRGAGPELAAKMGVTPETVRQLLAEGN